MSIRLLRRFTNLHPRSRALHALATKFCEICGLTARTRIRGLLDPGSSVLFGILMLISLTYFIFRYLALGPDYLFTNSYSTHYNPVWIAWMNILNAFAVFPQSYAQEHEAVLNMRTFLAHANALCSVVLAICVVRSSAATELKKAVIFALVLILINGFFNTALIRPRFSSVGHIGSVIIMVLSCHYLISVLFRKHPSFGVRTAVGVLLVLFMTLYAFENVENILGRQSPINVRRYAK